MNPTTRSTFVLLTSLLVSGQALVAQSASPFTLGALEVSATADVKPYNATEVREQLDRAHQLRVESRFSQARRAYNDIIKLQQSHNILPGEAMWGLAELYYSRKDLRNAAATLDQLADEAQQYGDPVLQARALVEAAIFYQQLGDQEKALTRFERLKPLLSSPFLPEATRTKIEARISRG